MEFSTILLSAPPLLLLYHLYKTCKEQKRQMEIYQKRHNCILMFGLSSIRGWGPNPIQLTPKNLYSFLEPYLYFINTSRKSLDIALMMLSIDQVVDALKLAAKRGVKIRVLLNFYSRANPKLIKLKRISNKIQIAYFICKAQDLSEIMHWKCMIKDFENGSGCLCIGSMNLSNINSALNNFEDVVFSTNKSLVESFHYEYQKAWDTIQKQNQLEFNQVVLREANLLN